MSNEKILIDCQFYTFKMDYDKFIKFKIDNTKVVIKDFGQESKKNIKRTKSSLNNLNNLESNNNNNNNNNNSKYNYNFKKKRLIKNYYNSNNNNNSNYNYYLKLLNNYLSFH